MLKKQLLDVLACPKCKGELNYEEKRNRLSCKKCRLRYAIIDDIPNMLIEEAEKY
jgi:hypothetical protein